MDISDLKEALDLLLESQQKAADEAGFTRGPKLAVEIVNRLIQELENDPEVIAKLGQTAARCLYSYAAVVLANALDLCLQKHALHVAEVVTDPEDILKDCALTTQVIGALPVRGVAQVAQFVAERAELIPTGSKVTLNPPELNVTPANAPKNSMTERVH